MTRETSCSTWCSGLVGESGEIAEKFKKWVRDLDSDESRIDRADIAKELGDVLGGSGDNR